MMLNTTIFLRINSLAGTSKILDLLGIFFAEYAIFGLVLILAVLCIIEPTRRNRLVAVLAVGAGVIARLLVVPAIRLVVRTPRPYLVMSVHQLVSSTEVYSFPSGHTIFVFALATVVAFYNKRLGIAFLVVAGLIGIARVFAGVHWPLDIVGGIVFGVATGYGVYKFGEKPASYCLNKVGL